MKKLLLVASMLLAGCGGIAAKPLNICLQPSDRIVAIANCDSTIQPVIPRPGETVEKFVDRQMLNSGNILLWVGRDDWPGMPNWRINHYAEIIAIVKRKYPDRVTHVYVVDEFNSCGAGGACLGRDDELVRQATVIAHAAGFRTVATITPMVVWAPGFVLPIVDDITVDSYPASLNFPVNMGACSPSNNPLANRVYCSGEKLRSMGHTGMYGWPFQAFGATTDTHEMRMAQLTMQREALDHTAEMRVDAIMAWGCYLGAPEIAAEPWLVPLCKTQYEYLVTP